jgi:hypothetical protein
LRAGINEVEMSVKPLPGMAGPMGLTTVPGLEVWLEKRRR